MTKLTILRDRLLEVAFRLNKRFKCSGFAFWRKERIVLEISFLVFAQMANYHMFPHRVWRLSGRRGKVIRVFSIFMISLSHVRNRIKTRLGELWWYTLILFCVQRLGDVVNAFVGLWLVPKYVSQDELGAVLPLMQIGTILGLPLSILLVPFMKFLNLYATRGEYGKVKRLLRDVFVLALGIFVATLLYARFFMTLVFERMRVGEGSLGLLIVLSGMLGTVSPAFLSALQALKRFKVIAVVNLLSAPVRLITMLIFMPIRALSGYFVGQSAPALLSIFVSLFGLRRQLGRQVKSESYWQTDWRLLARYTLPVAMVLAASAIQGAVEMFVIRHRLSDMDSAGYYVISRFAEMGAYVGLTMIMVLFPLAAEQHQRGQNPIRLLWHSVAGTVLVGFTLSCVFWFLGENILGMLPAWRDYIRYAPSMSLLTVIMTLRMATGCFLNFEMACGRSGFVKCISSVAAIECVLLYGLTGYSFFTGFLPEAWIDWMADIKAARLDFVLEVMLWSSIISFVFMTVGKAVQKAKDCDPSFFKGPASQRPVQHWPLAGGWE